MRKLKYSFVTTKKGQIPLEEVKEGVEVLSHGKWVKAPSPVKGIVSTCSFETLPTTSFEKKIINSNMELYCNHTPVLNDLENPLPHLSVRGYFKYREKNCEYVSFNFDDRAYWYPRLISIIGRVVFPNVSNRYNQMLFYDKLPEFSELCGNELAERNLEYYLEGLIRHRFFWSDNGFYFPTSMDESDRIVARLLNIDFIRKKFGFKVSNPVSLLSHIKDDYGKSKITEDMIRICLKLDAISII